MAPTENDIEKQLAYYQRKYDLNPRSRVFAPLADLLRKAGRVQEALPLLERGLTEHPRYVSALVILGRCHLEMGQSQAARDAFRKVLQLDPDNLVVLKLLAGDAARQEKWSEATGLLERIVVLDPSDEPSENRLAQLRTKNGEDQAETIEEDSEPEAESETETEFTGEVGSEAESPPEEISGAEPAPTPAEDETISTGEVETNAEVIYADEDDSQPHGIEEVISLEDIGEAIAEAAELLELESQCREATEEERKDEGAAGRQETDVETDVETDEETDVETEETDESVAEIPPGIEAEFEEGTETEIEAEIESEPDRVPETERTAELEPDEPADEEAMAGVAIDEEAKEDILTTEEDQKIGNRVDRESLATKTLAEIYLAQGYREKALRVLRQILERQPDRDDIRAKITTLETAATPEDMPETVEPSRAEEPEASEVATTEPAATESEAGLTGETASETAEPVAAERIAAEPLASEPITAKSITSESMATDPVAAKPEAGEPATGESDIPPSLDDRERVDRKKYFENWIQKISRQPDD